MTDFPRWKYALLCIVLLISVVYALPNIYGEDPAVQIIGIKGAPVDESLNNRVNDLLQQYNLEPARIKQSQDELLILFKKTAAQLMAHDLLKEKLGNNYSVALNLSPATPHWLTMLGAKPMKLGLDLRGGVRFVLEVDVASNIKRRIDSSYNELRVALRDQQLHYNKLSLSQDNVILVEFTNPDSLQQADTYINTKLPELTANIISKNPATMEITLLPAELEKLRNQTMEQTAATLRNRVNELGVAEAIIQREGHNRIVVELPGIQDTARAKDILGKTATLDFLMEDSDGDLMAAMQGRVPPGSKVYIMPNGRPVLLKKRIILTGDAIVGASSQYDSRDNQPVVAITIGGSGTRLFHDTTMNNIGKRMAVVYRESQKIDGEIVVTEKVISLATIQSALGNNFQISGLSTQEARDLALLLRAGAMPATLSIVEERIIGPSMGQENIDKGIQSVVVGFCLILVFMTLYYSVFGIIANITLFFNLIFLVALMSILGATLTLPGIAGIVLTLGMAVDANVLIFERIREEIRNNIPPQACIQRGFEQAFSTIVDSNLTTLIVGLILFAIGTGPVKGFAVTLSLGILTSLFTAVTGTRALVEMLYGKRKTLKLMVGI